MPHRFAGNWMEAFSELRFSFQDNSSLCQVDRKPLETPDHFDEPSGGLFVPTPPGYSRVSRFFLPGFLLWLWQFKDDYRYLDTLVVGTVSLSPSLQPALTVGVKGLWCVRSSLSGGQDVFAYYLLQLLILKPVVTCGISEAPARETHGEAFRHCGEKEGGPTEFPAV